MYSSRIPMGPMNQAALAVPNIISMHINHGANGKGDYPFRKPKEK
jgi:hypothetical protein